MASRKNPDKFLVDNNSNENPKPCQACNRKVENLITILPTDVENKLRFRTCMLFELLSNEAVTLCKDCNNVIDLCSARMTLMKQRIQMAGFAGGNRFCIVCKSPNAIKIFYLAENDTRHIVLRRLLGNFVWKSNTWICDACEILLIDLNQLFNTVFNSEVAAAEEADREEDNSGPTEDYAVSKPIDVLNPLPRYSFKDPPTDLPGNVNTNISTFINKKYGLPFAEESASQFPIELGNRKSTSTPGGAYNPYPAGHYLDEADQYSATSSLSSNDTVYSPSVSTRSDSEFSFELGGSPSASSHASQETRRVTDSLMEDHYSNYGGDAYNASKSPSIDIEDLDIPEPPAKSLPGPSLNMLEEVESSLLKYDGLLAHMKDMYPDLIEQDDIRGLTLRSSAHRNIITKREIAKQIAVYEELFDEKNKPNEDNLKNALLDSSVEGIKHESDKVDVAVPLYDLEEPGPSTSARKFESAATYEVVPTSPITPKKKNRSSFFSVASKSKSYIADKPGESFSAAALSFASQSTDKINLSKPPHAVAAVTSQKGKRSSAGELKTTKKSIMDVDNSENEAQDNWRLIPITLDSGNAKDKCKSPGPNIPITHSDEEMNQEKAEVPQFEGATKSKAISIIYLNPATISSSTDEDEKTTNSNSSSETPKSSNEDLQFKVDDLSDVD